MTTLPHDITDLYLAPVALAVDARIAELAALPPERLAFRVGLESDLPDWSRAFREDALIRAIGHGIERHGWEFEWDVRGLRLTHDSHTFVLGVPATFWGYLDG